MSDAGRLRTDRAAQLLRDTDDSILHIALEVGYASEQALSKAFTRRYETGAILVSSNRPVEDWGQVLGEPNPGDCPRRLTDPATRSSSLTARIRFLVNAFRWSTGSAPAGAIMYSSNCQTECGVLFRSLRLRWQTISLG